MAKSKRKAKVKSKPKARPSKAKATAKRKPAGAARPRGPQPIPAGYEGVIPYLAIKGAAGAIDFYKKAFGAEEVMRIGDTNMIGHAEIRVAGAMVMLADEFPDMGFLSPQSVGGTPVKIHIYVKDVDSFAQRAIDAGMTVNRPLKDEFYGDRACQLQDPYGHVWSFATHKEDIPPAEIQRRAAAMFGAGAEPASAAT
jgi:PhnB protein